MVLNGVSSIADKSITLGHPSYVWRFGQDRRLNLVCKYVDLENKRILDVGCGIGAYVRKFRQFSSDVHGVDIDCEKISKGCQSLPNLSLAIAENLPFADNTFDIVFLHEVIEHVGSDAHAIREAHRVAKPGGKIIIYAPNRLYPFETHGFYLGKRYVFGNIPLVNYLPNPLRKILVPHARAYLWADIRRLFAGLKCSLVTHLYVYPGFDNIASRRPWLAGVLRRILYYCENTPLRVFGLSHFVIIKKVAE